MKKFEELLAKRNAEIEAEERERIADEKNFNASIGSGILGTFYGLVIGFVVFFCVELFLEIVWSNKYGMLIFIISMLLGGIIGWYGGFNGTRKKS